MSHSKRNTSRAVFTSHERALAKSNWGTNSARLNRDSFLPFGSCGLCLEIARDPVSCPRGDVFCRECALANLIAQKREIKRAEKARLHEEQESAAAQAAEDEQVRERAVRNFELTQAGLAVAGRSGGAGEGGSATTNGAGEEPRKLITQGGAKRKFALDEDELSRNAREDNIRAKKAMDDEKAAKPSLPSFWTPSLTPGVEDSKLPPVKKKVKSSPVCPASAEDHPHHLSMQKLVGLQFNEQDDSTSGNKKHRTCPACLKTLSNSSSPVVSVSCGHVLCLSCVKKFMLPPKQAQADTDTPIMCYVCDTPIISSSSKSTSSASLLPLGLVTLKSEGTGFSARGTSTVEKSGIVFQC